MSSRNKYVGFKVSEEEKQTLLDCANIAGLDLSEYMRRLTLVPVSLEKKELFTKISKEALDIYSRWGYVLDKLRILVKDEKRRLK